jgi:hypothetical protein
VNARTFPVVVHALLAAAAALAPRAAGAVGLLERELTLGAAPVPDLHVVLAAQQADPSLDFDLLGEPPKPAVPKEDPALRQRRKMLNLHQGLGLGLLGLQVASTVTGQLNYNDKFGVANTDQFKLTHKAIVYTNAVAFAVVGGIALFAPADKTAPPRGFGRTTVHKICMAIATAGMVAQIPLGIATVNREGYLDQKKYGDAHLAVGYVTLAAMLVGVGVLVL